jgi:hypothetical protein
MGVGRWEASDGTQNLAIEIWKWVLRKSFDAAYSSAHNRSRADELPDGRHARPGQTR